MTKSLCIYHKNCFDGICAAWVTQKRFPGIDLLPMNYGDPLPVNVSDYEELILVDFSFKRAQLEFLAKSYKIMVIDHHKTAEKELEGLDYCIFDLKESGASLAWKTFFPNHEIPYLVKYVKDRDIWLFKEDHSEEINAYIQSFPMNIEYYDALYAELESQNLFNIALTSGEAILRYKDARVIEICKNATIYTIGGHKVPVVNTSLLFSEVGHELCKLYPEAPFSLSYYDRLKDQTRQYSLRSIGNFDVSEIAKNEGGGGHRNAAGWQKPMAELIGEVE